MLDIGAIYTSFLLVLFDHINQDVLSGVRVGVLSMEVRHQ